MKLNARHNQLKWATDIEGPSINYCLGFGIVIMCRSPSGFNMLNNSKLSLARSSRGGSESFRQNSSSHIIVLICILPSGTYTIYTVLQSKVVDSGPREFSDVTEVTERPTASQLSLVCYNGIPCRKRGEE